MSDQALDNAKRQQKQLFERKRELEADLRKVSAELADTESFIDRWYRFAGVTREDISRTEPDAPHPIQGESRSPKPKNSKKEDVAAEARRIIEEYGRPCPRKDLMDALLDRGFTINGGDPDMVLSTMLWRAGEAAGVVRLKGKNGGYWLKELPWPEALYHPQMAAPGVSYVKMPDPIADQWQDPVADYLADLSSSDILSIAESSEHRLPTVPQRLTDLATEKLGRALGPTDAEALAHALRHEVRRQAGELMEN